MKLTVALAAFPMVSLRQKMLRLLWAVTVLLWKHSKISRETIAILEWGLPTKHNSTKKIVFYWVLPPIASYEQNDPCFKAREGHEIRICHCVGEYQQNRATRLVIGSH